MTTRFSLAPSNFYRETLCQHLGDGLEELAGSLYMKDRQEVQDQVSVPDSQNMACAGDALNKIPVPLWNHWRTLEDDGDLYF